MHGSIPSIVCVFGRRLRFVLGWRRVFRCRRRSLRSLVDDLGVPFFFVLVVLIAIMHQAIFDWLYMLYMCATVERQL